MSGTDRHPRERAGLEDGARAEDPPHPILAWMRRSRKRLEGRPRIRVLYRILVAVVGLVVVVVGIILIPLPGPGWLIVFFGLAVLGTEFHWARRLTGFAKRTLARFWNGVRRRRSGTSEQTAEPEPERGRGAADRRADLH